MLSLKFIREHPDVVREALAKRGESAPVDDVLRLDEERRRLVGEEEALRARQNQVSKDIGRLKVKPPELLAEMKRVSERIKELAAKRGELEESLRQAMLLIPNIPAPTVPVGEDERGNVIVGSCGEPRRFDFTPLPHWDLAERLGIIDFERGVKLAGTRFYVLRGLGARLQRALITFMLDLHVGEHGYAELYPPYLVKREILEGSGQLPKFADNVYHDAADDLWLIPTAEVPLVNYHRDEILGPGTLPLRYVAYSACFRREQMAAGKDTRGIKRGHQFDKVEMVRICAPEHSYEALEEMVSDAADVLRRLEIPYRVKLLCTGDLGFAAAKTYDLEAWAPGCDEWLEVSSCSNAGDFQAVRANVRYRPAPGAPPRHPHLLNGSGLALPRTLIAVLENYQQADGSVTVPEALRPYMGGLAALRGD